MDNDDILSVMRKRMHQSISVYSDTRNSELDDLRFYAGSPDNQWQWPAEVIATRSSIQGGNSRACLTINKLPEHVRQVTNDQRQNRPRGKVIPADDKSDIDVAEIYDGIIRHIEYISNADVAYDTACENQVIYGEGYIRILTDYCNDNTFDQDLKIVRVRNSFSVYMDYAAQDPCGADAEWCIIKETLPKDEYERLWPDAQPTHSLQTMGIGDQSVVEWVSGESVTIAEYFYAEYENKILNLYPNNTTAVDKSPEDLLLKSVYGKPLKQRKVNERRIRWCKTNGYEVLESSEWMGRYIPVVRVVGNEFEVDGKIHISGLIRNAKDAQRMYNYWVSQEAEMLALAPKAPFIGYGGQFEGYENKWKTANTQNWPYLEVNPDATDGQGSPLPLPQRSLPPMAQTGLIQAKMGAADDIKSSTGQYNASLGQTSNERSGKAILARERQSDTGTYHYIDNMARAVRYVTRQLVDMIPKIYDTNRVARIIGVDNEVGMAKINPLQQEPVKPVVDDQGVTIEKIYNLGIGEYDVIVTTGPNYATKRQEALEAMAQLLQGNPQLWAVAGDLFVKSMDWPGSQEMAKRFAKTIDPKLMGNDDKSPELQAAEQQIQAMGEEMNKMHQMLQNINNSMEVREVEIKAFESKIKAFDAETKRLSVVQSGMTAEQIQEIVMGTIASAVQSGDLLPGNQSLSSQ